MKSCKSMLSIVMGGALLAVVPSALWAESGARAEASEFLNGAVCPPPAGAPCFDPSAGGQKIVGTLAVVYEKGTSDDCITPYVQNMYVLLTLEQGNKRVPFSSDYIHGPPAHDRGFCMLNNAPDQVQVILALVRNRVLPYFYSCDANTAGSCPGFKVKSVTNFQYTTGDPLLIPNPNVGGFSADISIAVQ